MHKHTNNNYGSENKRVASRTRRNEDATITEREIIVQAEHTFMLTCWHENVTVTLNHLCQEQKAKSRNPMSCATHSKYHLAYNVSPMI